LHRRQPFHVLHAHSALPCGHAAALLSRELGIPFMVTVHGLDAFFTGQVGGYAGQWCARMASLVYREAANVICVSEKVRQQVASRLGDAVKTKVIYNGVDPEIFFPAKNDAESEVILSVGSLIGIKGHELLLRAIARVQELRLPLRCEIIGEGPDRERLESLSSDLGLGDKVRFLGRRSREQVAEAMRRCKLFALPSRYEGLGCVYLEAMCCGKAVIACRGQGIEEVIESGINGWLVTPDDLQELTDALLALLRERDLRSKMGEAARDTILQGYTLEHQAHRLSDTYRECLS
jgi:glycosyltransferase involved in cell wall biosynthesis